jgi:beta-barrel assembly-enhancing protease
LTPLLAKYPTDPWIVIAMAENEARSGNLSGADARMDTLLARMPNHRAAALSYARLLAERNDVGAGKRAQSVLRPLLIDGQEDPVFQSTFARASEVAGDPARAGEAYAEAEFLNGRPERALIQLNTLLKRPELDYYARARVESRIAAITPAVLELKRLGVRDEVLERR